MNCPELTLGLYTSDEIIDGNFDNPNDASFEDKIQEEIAENANKVVFTIDESKQNVEKEKSDEIPDFMMEG